jgi:uncharacterized repeat protein (TIGR04138 family)
MRRDEFAAKVDELVEEDSRYAAAAYHFVADAVSYTARKIRETQRDSGRHISGQELLEGIREFALGQFGPLALDVLTDWGVRKTEDFGAIVFRMVGKGLLGSSEQDSHLDFAKGYDFREAFLKPFMPPPGMTEIPPPEKIL